MSVLDPDHPLFAPVWEPPVSRLADISPGEHAVAVVDTRDTYRRHGILTERTGSVVDGPMVCAGHVDEVEVLGRFATAYGRPLDAGVWPSSHGRRHIAQFDIRVVPMWIEFVQPAWCTDPGHTGGVACRCDRDQPAAIVVRWYHQTTGGTEPATLATLHPPTQPATVQPPAEPVRLSAALQATVAGMTRPARRALLRQLGWRATTDECASMPGRLPERWYRDDRPGRYTLTRAVRIVLAEQTTADRSGVSS